MPKLTLLCAGCGIAFERYYGRQPCGRVFHSAACQHAHQTHRTGPPYSKSGPYAGTHVCARAECAVTFSPNHPAFKYCSDYCRRKAQQDRTKARWQLRQVVSADYKKKNRKEYKIALLAQQPDCGICRRPFAEMSLQQVHVDHDHLTGKIRGLLCFKCNAGLGQFGDSLELLAAAMVYIRQHRNVSQESICV